jgi:hypothetical protein
MHGIIIIIDFIYKIVIVNWGKIEPYNNNNNTHVNELNAFCL